MTDEKWQQFFDLVHEIMLPKGDAWTARMEEMVRENERLAQDPYDIYDLAGWFLGSTHATL